MQNFKLCNMIPFGNITLCNWKTVLISDSAVDFLKLVETVK